MKKFISRRIRLSAIILKVIRNLIMTSCALTFKILRDGIFCWWSKSHFVDNRVLGEILLRHDWRSICVSWINFAYLARTKKLKVETFCRELLDDQANWSIPSLLTPFLKFDQTFTTISWIAKRTSTQMTLSAWNQETNSETGTNDG